MSIKSQTGFDRTMFVDQVAKSLSALVKIELDKMTRTCVNCERFDQTRELCGIYSARPPAVVIVIGCEKHKEIDDIPF